MHHPRRWAAIAAAVAAPAVHALDIPVSDPDMKVRLDMTPKYSTGYRLKNPSTALTRLDVAGEEGRVVFKDGCDVGRVLARGGDATSPQVDLDERHSPSFQDHSTGPDLRRRAR